MKPSPTDSELLHKIVQRDQYALSELYRRYGELVYSLAYYILQNPGLAEEATQDTFIKIWYHAGEWKPALGKFGSWLLTITRYTAIDRLRKERRHTITNLPLERALAETNHQADRWEIRGEHVYDLMKQLSVEQARVIELAYFQGMTHSQMARELKLPLGTVKTRLRLGLMKLKSLMEETTSSSLSEVDPLQDQDGK